MDTKLIAVIGTSALVLLGTVAVSILIGRRRAAADTWQTAGGKLPVYVVAGTQLATLMGGGVLVGQVGVGYESGWSTVTYGVLTAVGLVPLMLMATWLRASGLATLPGVLTRLYGRSRAMDVITVAMSVVIPFGWLCTNLVAFGNLFSLLTGLSPGLLIPIFALLCLGLVIPGGLASVAWTDFIFGVLMVVLAVVTVVYTLGEAGGWAGVTAALPANVTELPGGLGAVGSATVLLWLFAVMPGNLTNQQVYQRVFAASSPRDARTGLIVAAVLYACALVWAALMGMSVRALNPNLGNPELALGWLLTQIPTALLALFAAFIVATIMSTASSAVQSVVVNLTSDIYGRYVNPDASSRRMLRLSQLTSVAVVTLGTLLALYYQEALAWLVMTFAYSVAALLMPILVGFLLRKTGFLNTRGAVAGMITGVVAAGVAHALGTAVPYVAYGMLGSLVGLLLFSALLRGDSGTEEGPRLQEAGRAS